MIKNFKCVNISSKDPKALADFYISIGAPVFIEMAIMTVGLSETPNKVEWSACGMRIVGVSLRKDLLLLF